MYLSIYVSNYQSMFLIIYLSNYLDLMMYLEDV
jgi:hypothetical protein